MSEKLFIETVLEIVDNAVDQIEQLEPGETFAPETYLIAAQGAWAVPVSWQQIKSEEKTEVAAVQKIQKHAREIGVNAVVTLMMERYRGIKTLSFRGDEAYDLKRNNPLVLFVNIKNSDGHLVLLLSFDKIKGRHKEARRLWGEVNNGRRR